MVTMELKGLESVQQGGTAPVSVGNQYLEQLMDFIKNKWQFNQSSKHTFDQSLEFDNNGLDVIEPFFTYENEPNKTYESIESITGNKEFDYNGPTPYYSDFKL